MRFLNLVTGSNYCLFDRVKIFTSYNIIGQSVPIAEGSRKERIFENVSVTFWLNYDLLIFCSLKIEVKVYRSAGMAIPVSPFTIL